MRRILVVGVLVVAAAVLFLAVPGLSGRLSVEDPRFLREAVEPRESAAPRVLRFVHPEEGGARFGLVVGDERGLPTRVLDLSARWPELGSGLATFLEADGFELADAAWLEFAAATATAPLVELPADRLAELVLPPVDLTLAQIDRGERVVVGVGFNFAEHAAEAGEEAMERLAFAKAVAPTSAYAPVPVRRPSAVPEGLEPLLDYEVELAMIVLEDLDLTALPADPAELDRRVAWTAANDVSGRWPIILDGDAGFTEAKSQPGYLPLGPWMVAGRHLGVAADRVDLRLWLEVDEASAPSAARYRQYASTRQLVRRPLQVLEMLAQIHGASLREDDSGALRGVVVLRDGVPVLPAGSVVLTGTPEGTAVEAPSAWDRARLFVRSGFSIRRAREAYGRHLAAQHEAMGFLEPGDVVRACIDGLGCQLWTVERGTPP